ncbi:MAG TPA: hypothetical protein PLN52_26570 [Opitutaceae bacterium]|nr:hypothetical protein [Opitutaceae bacterium]
MTPLPSPPSESSGTLTRALIDLISKVPRSTEAMSDDPLSRARAIAKSSSLKAAAISGAMALPPGPLGIITLVPDLLAIWKLQQTMVADIAAAFGKTTFLARETMVYCLFKHGSAALVRDIAARVGERIVIRTLSAPLFRSVLERLGVRLAERVVAKSVARWLPVIGAVGVSAYAYADTAKVAATAIDVFSRDLVISEDLAEIGKLKAES